MSAAELAAMFHLYFLGSTEGLVFDVPRDTFPTSLWIPLERYLTGLGAQLNVGRGVRSVETGGTRRFRVHADNGLGSDVDGVVLAADIAGLQNLMAHSPELGTGSWRRAVAQMRLAPPFLVRRLWLDTPVRSDRPAFLGTGSLPPLDNISVLDRFEAEAATWARSHRGSVVELHAYAVTEDAEELPERLLARLHQLYPETAGAAIVGDLSEWRQDCPLFGLGDFARRPGITTPHDGLVLAGDGIRVDLPVALMERAATTGWHAANRLLTGWGLAGHVTYSVPNQGRLAPLRALARWHASRR
jgi:isorenieratene synthase